jgi:MSHA biogenesis protein MshN
MSVINKMLQDLDRRHAMPAADGANAGRSPRAVGTQGGGHEWFWRSIATLMVLALAWVGWVAYQLQPRPLATESALQSARTRAPTVAKVVAPLPVAPAPKPSAAAEAAPPPPPELFRLAQSIGTPISAPAAKPASTPDPTAPKPDAKRAGDAGKQQVNRRDRPRSAGEDAEIAFRAGVNRLNQGRTSEAAQQFESALAIDPKHQGARQALVAVHLERRELDAAQRLLTEGLALFPDNAQFATVLARISIERGDYAGALDLLLRTREAGLADAEHQMLLGTVLQRMGRHAEAVSAFQNAARLVEQPAATWVALGISYEGMGSKPEALRAYRQSLAAGPTSAEVRSYAENRIRALK